jgi:signal transduction histidine kinase
LANAVRFTQVGSVSLEIIADATDLHEGTETLGPFRFRVCDTGPGICQDDVDRIFEPFDQGSQADATGGTGLGLAIVRTLVRMMQGEITVASKPGHGCCFEVTLPLKQARMENGAAASSRPFPVRVGNLRMRAGARVRALIVDDVLENREVLGAALRDAGCEVFEVASGEAALETVARAEVDIVFLDFRMPGLNGIETACRLRAQAEIAGVPGARLVCVSASALLHERDASLRAGFDSFLAKPFQWEQVWECLTVLLPESLEWISLTAATQTAPAEENDAKVPPELLAQIVSAAERYRTPELKRMLEALAQRGHAERRLAERLRTPAAVYDMKTVLEILEEQRMRQKGSSDPL